MTKVCKCKVTVLIFEKPPHLALVVDKTNTKLEVLLGILCPCGSKSKTTEVVWGMTYVR